MCVFTNSSRDMVDDTIYVTDFDNILPSLFSTEETSYYLDACLQLNIENVLYRW